MHTYLFISYLRIQFHTRLLAAARTHTGSHVSVMPLTLLYYYSETTHSCAAPPYLAAWVSGPLAYISFPHTFAPSHRAQVLIQSIKWTRAKICMLVVWFVADAAAHIRSRLRRHAPHARTSAIYTHAIFTGTFTYTQAHLHTHMHIISQTTDNAPHAIHTASIDPQIRNDLQHLSSIERPTMWYR